MGGQVHMHPMATPHTNSIGHELMPATPPGMTLDQDQAHPSMTKPGPSCTPISCLIQLRTTWCAMCPAALQALLAQHCWLQPPIGNWQSMTQQHIYMDKSAAHAQQGLCCAGCTFQDRTSRKLAQPVAARAAKVRCGTPEMAPPHM